MGNMSLAADLDYILTHTRELWEDARGKSLFLTGGTGLFGCWLLESFALANARFNLNASLLVLSRNPGVFAEKHPSLANNPAITFHQGDVRNYVFPTGKFHYIIHAATTTAQATFDNEDPLVKFDTVLQGTRRTLEFAGECGAERVLMTSSGAAYGQQPPDISHLREEHSFAPMTTSLNSALGEAKRAAELMCAIYADRYNIPITIGRCFSFVGPFLPLHIHYAIGNFIRDGLAGGPILVNGDGSPIRSYLYMADLLIWLWTLLLRGDGQLYNIGSDQEISIGDLARTVARSFEQPIEVIIANQADPKQMSHRYVPAVDKIARRFGLRQRISLTEGIKKTIAHVRLQGHHYCLKD